MSTIKTETLSTPSNSTVPVDTVVNGTAKAWVNFNGTGTVAIRRAFNVSSITDVGTGDYTLNFTAAMVDANYSAVLGSERTGANDTGNICIQSPGTTTLSVSTFPYNSATRADVAVVCVAIFS